MSSGKRQPVQPYFAGFQYVGDPATATAATLDRLVRHVMTALKRQDAAAGQVAR